MLHVFLLSDISAYPTENNCQIAYTQIFQISREISYYTRNFEKLEKNLIVYHFWSHWVIDLATIYTCYDRMLLGKQRPKVAEVNGGRAGLDLSLKPAPPHAPQWHTR